ncbi:hypothetical protein SRHO_G00128940 [Serrasalmus rhombeus]
MRRNLNSMQCCVRESAPLPSCYATAMFCAARARGACWEDPRAADSEPERRRRGGRRKWCISERGQKAQRNDAPSASLSLRDSTATTEEQVNGRLG